MDRLLQDVRFALRGLRRRPLFAVVAAGSLAIGIGANTTLFGAVNGLLLKPLPGMPNAEQVVELGRGRAGSGFDTFTHPDFADIRTATPALAAATAFATAAVSVAQEGEGTRAFATYADEAFFQVLGLVPAHGRWFTAQELAGVGEPVAVLSWDLWQNTFGGDLTIVGGTVRLNREPFTVVGIAPASFQGQTIGARADLYLPLSRHPLMAADGENRAASWHWALGLLAPGSTVDEVNAQLAGVATRLSSVHPETNENRTFSAVPLGPLPGGVRPSARLFLGVLMGLVGLVLLVTCANVGGMFLARAAHREREVAVRLALGAGRGALVRQLTVESMVVFVLGGVLGFTLAVWAAALLRPEVLPFETPLNVDLSPDLRVLAFSVAATLGTGLLFGLLPALQATRLDLVASLREEGRGAAGGRRGSRLRRTFVAGQVGFSLVLLVAAGLFLRSLQRAATTETGFDPEGAYMTALDLSLEGYDREEGHLFQVRLLESLRGRFWVQAAALATDLPLDLSSHGTVTVPEGWPADAPDPGLGVEFAQVSPGYFETLHIALVAGRDFQSTDTDGSERVAVVSRSFAQRAWPGEDALGRNFLFGSLDPERGTVYRVVGVVADVKNQLITDEAGPMVYAPLAQQWAGATQVVVRAQGGLEQVGPALRAAVLDVDPSLPQATVVDLADFTAVGVLPQRVAAGLTSALGLLALFLSGLGVYGMVAYAVGQQTREIGIRMALGADRARVLARVVREAAWLALPGVGVGALLAFGVARVMQGMLLGVSSLDPVALGGVALVLLAVVGVATWLPARRAASVDPAVALRHE